MAETTEIYFLTVLAAGSPRSAWSVLVRALFVGLEMASFKLCPHITETGRKPSGVFLIRVLIHHEVPILMTSPELSQKPHLQMPFHWEFWL